MAGESLLHLVLGRRQVFTQTIPSHQAPLEFTESAPFVYLLSLPPFGVAEDPLDHAEQPLAIGVHAALVSGAGLGVTALIRLIANWLSTYPLGCVASGSKSVW